MIRTRPSGRAIILVAAALAVAITTFVASTGADRPGPTSSSPPAQPSPTAVTVETFCAGFIELQAALGEFAGGSDGSIAEVKAAARKAQQLGRATVIPRTALAGLEYILGLILSLDDNASPEALTAADTGASIEDSANAADFAAWQSEACPVGG